MVPIPIIIVLYMYFKCCQHVFSAFSCFFWQNFLLFIPAKHVSTNLKQYMSTILFFSLPKTCTRCTVALTEIRPRVQS